MALEFAVRSFVSAGADAVGTTYSITGLSFAPIAGICLWTNGTNTVDYLTAGTCRYGIGFFTGPTDRRAVENSSADAAATSSCDQGRREDAVIFSELNSVFEGVIDVDAMLSDGVRFIRDVAGTNYTITVILFGGADITNAVTGDFTEPAAAGNFDAVTSLSFEPTIVFFMGGRATVDGQTTNTHAQLGFGVGMNAPPGTSKPGDFSACFAISGRSEDAVGTSNTDGSAESADCMQLIDVTTGRAYALEWIQSLVNGFRLNQRGASAGGKFVDYLAIRGGGWKVGRGVTSTGVSNFTLGPFPFIPKGLIVVSQGAVEDAPASNHVNNRWSIGAFDSPTSRQCRAFFDRDAQGTSQVSRGGEFDEGLLRISDTDTIEALMDLVSFDAEGTATLVMDDADIAANFFGFVACGDEPPLPRHVLSPILLQPLYRSA